MMREELVNYMNKLHEVKNMMYIAVGSILLFTISDTLPIICVLLPLLFVLPIYISAVNYWLCIRKISSYLVVFHESYEDCPIHWESRNNMLKKIGIREKENFSKSTFSNIPTQLYPYYTCASMTITVYFLQLYKYAIKEMKLHSSINFLMISIDGIKVYIHIIIGVVIIIF
ncbi:hypothetical protein C823_007848 [Eubacterium plexicaudatum ASF492]|nr:hypothetical protein C823_007848 [Eubacterium plexicaudatum ASF492]